MIRLSITSPADAGKQGKILKKAKEIIKTKKLNFLKFFLPGSN